MRNKFPKISVFIPVKNGAPWLDACIQGIMRQTLFHQAEIVAVDSGSTDDSLTILKKYPVRLYTIPPSEFNHGLTRNYGVQLCRGQYVVMTVQDAKPVDNLWLEKLLIGFSAAENVAGVCGSQIAPHSRDVNPVEWFRPSGTPVTQTYRFNTPDEFYALAPLQKMYACGWDDVTAIYRREVLLKIPFRKISYGEDAIWAKEALLAGYTLVYNPGAYVYHFHQEDSDFTFRRTLTVMHLRYRQFGCIYNRPAKSVREWLSIYKTILLAQPLTLKEKWAWIKFNRHYLRARQKAYDVFSAALAESEDALDKVHEKYCGLPPVPKAALALA